MVDIVVEATPMRLDSKSVRDGKMDGGQAWKVIPGIPFMIIKENAALNDVQVEVNYAIKLDDQWTVRPGMLTHFSSNGTRYGPYVKLSWDATKILILAFAIVTTGKLTDNKTYPVICLVITFIVGMDMSLTILIVISPSHGKRRYTANRTIIAMQTIRNGRRKMHLFYNTI